MGNDWGYSGVLVERNVAWWGYRGATYAGCWLSDLALGVCFGDKERSLGGGPGAARLCRSCDAAKGGGDSTSGRDREEIPKKAPPAPTPTKMQVDLG